MYERKKVFGGWCPYDEVYETQLNSDCNNCPNYIECLRQKRRRTLERKALRRRKRIIRCLTAIFIVLFVCVFTHLIYQSNLDVCDEANEVLAKESVQVNGKQINSGAIDEIEYATINEIGKSSCNVKEMTEENSAIEEETQIVETDTEEEIQTVEVNDESTSFDDSIEESDDAVISAYKASDTYYYQLSDEDKVYIAKVVYQEARGESFEGKVAVASVVLNRYYSDDDRFDTSSIYSVVTQKTQFASISDVSLDMLNSVPECMEAVESACKGWDPTRKVFSEGAKFFYAPSELSEQAAEEREGIKYLSIGNHNFHNDFNKNY
jgi:N-acetylmuramoyl-L-alanine amidase